MTWMRRLAATLATLAVANGAVITRLTGVNRSEIHQASAGGGTHVYLLGTSLGSAFSPPTVRIGITAGAGTECVVQDSSALKRSTVVDVLVWLDNENKLLARVVEVKLDLVG